MDLHIIPFSADIEKVKAVFGSKDNALFNKIQETKLFLHYDEELSFKRELYDIIFNYVPKEKRTVTSPKLFGLIKAKDNRGLEGDWHDYAYALLCTCGHIGKQLCSQDTLMYNESWDNLNRLLANNNSLFDLRRMIKSTFIFDTPFKKEEITCNYYDKKEVHELVADFLKIESFVSKESEGTIKLYNLLKEGLLYCSEHNNDLISFSIEIED